MTDSSDRRDAPRIPSDPPSPLQQRHGADTDPSTTLSAASSDSAAADAASAPAFDGERYTFEGEIARGGMGAVLGVYDQDLRRRLAMKMILTEPDGSVDQSTLGRFLEEAQVTAQLDHPGVVPVHELGLDGEGQVYFTMKLVKGEDLRSVFEKVKSGEDGWNTTRVLNLLLRVCEAMAFAHSKGVIHRDLKPANIMVGRFGEVYVMDWGIARVLGEPDRKDLRIRKHEPRTSIVRSGRKDPSNRDGSPDSPLMTMDGDVVGTPAYMPIEQAEGRIDEVGPESDIYSLGAILYELLASQMPYVRPGARLSPRSIHAAVVHGSPEPLEQLAPNAPPELVAIASKAMAREKGDRYSSMIRLADDLRAFLEHRVVQAYRTGALVELRKWVQRNMGLAATLLVAVLLALGGTTVVALVTDHKNDEIQGVNDDLDRTNSELDDRLTRITRLADLPKLRQLERRAETLWPARPELVDAMEEWLEEAYDLLGRRTLYEDDLRELRARADDVEAAFHEALSGSAAYRDAQEASRILAAEIKSLPNSRLGSEELPAPERRVALERERAKWEILAQEVHDELRTSVDPGLQWRNDNLTALVSGLRALGDAEQGLVRDVEERLERARTIEDGTVVAHHQAWSEAIEAITTSENYAGLELEPMAGIVPIGADPDSELWEFWHVESGTRPERNPESGHVAVTEEMGVVLVLIPGGTFLMGASQDPASPNHDPDSRVDEQVVHEVTLQPFMLSKFELTAGQWFRLTGNRPSSVADSHPVGSVSWSECALLLPRHGLRLPSEAQWEYAARAGTSTPWWYGDHGSVDDPNALVGNAWTSARNSVVTVGTFRANPFGLHDVVGNVMEWCQDQWEEDAYGKPVSADDGHRLLIPRSGGPCYRIARGGSCMGTRVHARSASRHYLLPSERYDYFGLRPAQEITRN